MTYVGVDAIGIALPHAYLDLADLAEARAVLLQFPELQRSWW